MVLIADNPVDTQNSQPLDPTSMLGEQETAIIDDSMDRACDFVEV